MGSMAEIIMQGTTMRAWISRRLKMMADKSGTLVGQEFGGMKMATNDVFEYTDPVEATTLEFSFLEEKLPTMGGPANFWQQGKCSGKGDRLFLILSICASPVQWRSLPPVSLS